MDTEIIYQKTDNLFEDSKTGQAETLTAFLLQCQQHQRFWVFAQPQFS